MSNHKHEDHFRFFPFGPFLARTKMPESVRLKMLEEGKKMLPSYNHALAGHLKTQFEYPDHMMDYFYGELAPFLKLYRDKLNWYYTQPDSHVVLKPESLWINFYKPGDFNPIHNHFGDYSFVFFLDIPKELEKEQEEFEGTGTKPGETQFFMGADGNNPKWQRTGLNVNPQTGDLYFFPAQLPHWVTPYKSNVQRISVSGNLTIANRADLPKDYI